MRAFSDEELEAFRSRIAEFIKPLPIPTGELAARSGDGSIADGELIILPYLPSEIAELPAGEALALVQRAVDLSAERGAKVIGLGGFSSIVADSGIALRAPAGITLTSGNSFATWAAIRAVEAACRSRGLSPSHCTVAIIGAAGAIGHALSLLCAERMAKLILIGNPRAGAASIAKLGVLVGSALAAVIGAAQAQERRATRFWNLTGETIMHLSMAPTGTADWGPDQCRNDPDGSVDFESQIADSKFARTAS
jgi:hypothetical protein